MRQLILESFQSPGDVTVMTAAARDLHLAHPGQFQTDVRTTARELWENNPHVTPIPDGTPGVERIQMHYPSIHSSNQKPGHFITAYPQFLEERLGVRIPVTQFKGDIHLSAAEKAEPPRLGFTLPIVFWLIFAGGKYDFTAKWWNPASFQKVVDYFQGAIQFIQAGEANHWHLPLHGVINLLGKTTTRQLVHLMHYASGVLCPVTFAMHLSAAVETRRGGHKNRPCVVIAGGREPMQWEAYPHHQYIATNGMLTCCLEGGCWKSRCQLVGDGDSKDRQDVCEQPVQLTPQLRIPRCMDMITPDDVIRRIEMYYSGGLQNLPKAGAPCTELLPVESPRPMAVSHSETVPTPNCQEKNMWEQLPGLAREISAGPNGSLWCLGIGDSPNGYSLHEWHIDHWNHIDGQAVQIAAGADDQAWIVNRDHRIFSRSTNDWMLRPGSAREVAISADGSIWCISARDIAPGGGSIHIWNGNDWDHVDGAAVKIAVGPDGLAWIVNSAGQVFRRSGEGFELLPGLASEIAISPEGSVWCLSKGLTPEGGHSIHFWNGTDWDHIPGAAFKIAAGPAGTVFIVNQEHEIFRSVQTSQSPVS